MTRSRALFFAAAALAVLSLALPLWGFRMSAPQYPGESLHLRVTGSTIGGDVQEIATLQKNIGVHFPETTPELAFLTPAIGALALILFLAGFAGAGAAGRVGRVAAAALAALFLIACAGLLQKRLYDVGHERDPRAPIRAVRDFTPPLAGPVKVGNFTVWSYPHAGGAALALATLLALLGCRSPEKLTAAVACGCNHASARPGDAAA